MGSAKSLVSARQGINSGPECFNDASGSSAVPSLGAQRPSAYAGGGMDALEAWLFAVACTSQRSMRACPAQVQGGRAFTEVTLIAIRLAQWRPDDSHDVLEVRLMRLQAEICRVALTRSINESESQEGQEEETDESSEEMEAMEDADGPADCDPLRV